MGRRLQNEKLAKALEKTTEFSGREWEAFGLTDLQKNDVIKVGNAMGILHLLLATNGGGTLYGFSRSCCCPALCDYSYLLLLLAAPACCACFLLLLPPCCRHAVAPPTCGATLRRVCELGGRQ